MRWRNRVLLGLAIALFYAPSSNAEVQKDVQYIRGYLSGYELQVTYRDGEALYGTYFFLDVHFCPSGKYWSHVQSRKQTVLGNEQVNSWNDSGNWDVAPFQGYVTLRYISASGARDIVPLERLPDGGIRPLSGAFMKRRGKAQCR
jgi:hypothetical protein